MLLRDYQFEISLPPCNPQAQTVNAIANLSDDIQEVLPYLNATQKGCIYNHKGNILMMNKDGKRITVYPKQIAIAKLRDKEDAKETLECLKQIINETYENRQNIEPNYTSKDQLKTLDVYKLLPRSNCKACGEATCLAFAAKLVAEAVDVTKCSPLFTDEYQKNRESLLELMVATGYEVPDMTLSVSA